MVLVYRFTLSKKEHANWVVIGLIAFALVLTTVLAIICAVLLVLIPWSNYPSITSLIPDLSLMSANIASSLVLFSLFLASNIVAMILRYVINSYDKNHLIELIRSQNGVRLEPVHDYYLSIPITPFLDEISRKFKTYPQEKINSQKRLVFQRITQFTKLLSKKLEAMDLDVVYASDFAETSDGQVQFPTTEDATKEFERKMALVHK
jgi:hypothetical protein